MQSVATLCGFLRHSPYLRYSRSPSFLSSGLTTSNTANMSNIQPLIIAGPSGVGKGTLITKLLNEYPQLFRLSVSHTTRGPRPGESTGVHYFFVDHATFQKMKDCEGFLECADVHGNCYGTSWDMVRRAHVGNEVCVLDIDVQGAVQVRKTCPTAYSVFIFPPSEKALEARLRGRATETEEAILKRLANGKKEMEFARANPDGVFNDTMVNDNPDECVLLSSRVHRPT